MFPVNGIGVIGKLFTTQEPEKENCVADSISHKVHSLLAQIGIKQEK